MSLRGIKCSFETKFPCRVLVEYNQNLIRVWIWGGGQLLSKVSYWYFVWNITNIYVVTASYLFIYKRPSVSKNNRTSLTLTT